MKGTGNGGRGERGLYQGDKEMRRNGPCTGTLSILPRPRSVQHLSKNIRHQSLNRFALARLGSLRDLKLVLALLSGAILACRPGRGMVVVEGQDASPLMATKKRLHHCWYPR
ncbi:hypothetical protein FA13DRAFT_242445 [Coprinellus micaceus]|uniref:Uncharacterized protein n=1 Tax=Coprinellus micaceus TaxID=71717 RepID=A0A4Y7SF95_COPMI|nr:hypothetical protein FA13DRAFT_242445 [Coprinellus micaceus]